jgi:nitroreductase
MEPILEIIKKRMSIRAYQNKALTAETINSILEAAKHAPTARNLQELEYKVITNQELIQKASDSIGAVVKKDNPAMPARPNFFYNAPLLIIITGPGDNPWIHADAGLAAQNIMLYATSINLGTCFIGMARMIEKDQEMLKKLHIAEGRLIAAAIVCGYPDEKPAAKEKKINVEFIK